MIVMSAATMISMHWNVAVNWINGDSDGSVIAAAGNIFRFIAKSALQRWLEIM